jgi:copper(I)-binding protein
VAKELPGLSGAIRRFTTAAATVAVGALLVAGCAAGQDTQTINQRPPIDGASADAGAVSIRTAAVVDDQGGSYTKGGNAQLRMVIINNGAQQLELQSVSSPLAGSAQLSDTGSGDTESASPGASSTAQSSSAQSTSAQSSSAQSSSAGSSATASSTASTSGTASGSPSASATTSASSSDTASASASSSAPASTPISIPPGESVQVGFGTDGPSITLTGLTTDLYPAQAVPVTLTFADGSTVSMTIPVQLPSSAPSAPVISDATEPAEPKN